MRVVAYVRISRDTDDSTSIPRQKAITRQYAEARGWTVVETCEDVDVSATKRRLDRPGLSRARALVAEGAADAVVVWRLDRLARSVVDMGTLLDEGLQVVSATEPLDTTSPMGRAMVEILQVFAALESATIGARITSTRAYLAGEHKHGGASPPYGYRSVPHPSGKGRALEVDPDEAQHVRAAADYVLTGGSLYGATQLLRERGARPRKAQAWALTSVRVILTHDAILGRLRHRGELVRDTDGVPVQPWPAVLPLHDVERLRALLTRKPAGERRTRAARLLSGLALCDGCGAPMRVNTSRQANGAEVIRYACAARSDGRECPHPTAINAPLLEDFVVAGFLGTSGELTVREKVVTVEDVPELAEVSSTLTDLGRRITEPGADVATLAEQIGRLQERRTALEAQPVEPVVEYVETGVTYADWWAGHDDTAERRDLLAATGLLPLRVRPGARGRKGLDPARVLLARPDEPVAVGAWEVS